MLKKLTIICTLLLFSYTLSGCTNKNDMYKKYIEEGNNHLSNHCYSDAISSFINAKEIKPTQADPYIKISNIFYQKGRISDALSYLNEGIAVANDKKALYYRKGTISFNTEEYKTSIDEFNKAQEEGYDSDSVLIYTIKSYIKINNIESAVKYTEHFNNQGIKSYFQAILSIDDPIKAYELIEKAQKSKITDANIIKDIDVFIKLIKEAKEQSEKEITNEQYIKLLHGYSLLKIKEYTLAERILKPVYDYYKRENKTSFQTNLYLGVVYYNQDDYQKASEFLEESINANPTNTDTLHLLALTYTKLNNQVKALDYFGRLIDLDEKNEEARTDYINTLQKYNLHSKILVQYIELIKLNTNNKYQYTLETGQYLIDQNNIDQAFTYIESIVKDEDIVKQINPSCLASAYTSLANIYIKQEDYNLAEEKIKKALYYDENNAQALYIKAVILEKNNNIEEAVRYYRKTIDESYDESLSNKAYNKIQDLKKE